MKDNAVKNRKLWNICSIVLAVALWQVTAMTVNNSLLIAGPIESARALFRQAVTALFWQASLLSAGKIALSFILAFICAALLAALASTFPVAEILLRPYIVTIKTVPVASFIVIAILWLSASRLSVFIAFLMVLPMLYQNMLQGIKSADKKMLQMAEVFRFSPLRRLRLIYAPAVEPYVLSASKAALGMSWKAGIAAEVMGISPLSIGGNLYEAKTSLEIPQVFAWTVMTVILSIAFEKVMVWLLKAVFKRIEDI